MAALFLSTIGDFIGGIGYVLLWIISAAVIIAIAVPFLKAALYGIMFVAALISNTRESSKFEKQARLLSPKVKEILGSIDEFFSPKRKVEQIHIDALLSEYKDIIEAVNELYSRKNRNDNVLRETSLASFRETMTPYWLSQKMKENNHIYNSINRLKVLAVKAFETNNELNSLTHYYTYSDMVQFKNSLEEVKILSEVVLPKYEKCLGEDEKLLLNIYDSLESKRKIHNELFITNELRDNKTYFDTVLGQYPLDPQQRDSIVKLEDNCLVIASAGSGKTSTILGKAKYLVEKRNIDPSKILLITYTRKAANELHERMKIEGMTCSTFHALAYNIIAQVTGQAPSICDADVPLRVFYKLIETNKDFLHAINNYIINQQSLMGLEHDYYDAFSYFEDRKKYGIQALFPDVDGKIIFTRSEEEKRLVSILTRLSVPFRYENAYQFNTTTPERRQYRPDFTIYYQDNQGQWRWLYLEHFAIDSNGNVPEWFGDGERGGWQYANQKYNEGIQWKRATHQQYGTTLITTTSADFRDGTIETKLKGQLRWHGVPYKERTDEELYSLLVSRNKKLEKSVYTLILSFITLMKANEKTIDGLLQELEPDTNNPLVNAVPQNNRSKIILTDIIKPFYEEYERTLRLDYKIDFTDAILQATGLCRKGLWRHYEYILVDEFQDISIDRYKFLQALRGDGFKTKLFCVGDDWQSIFRFAGSDMSLVYEFEKYFGFTELCKIETTYRFHQPLIDKSSEFIMKNKEQKEKTIKTPDGDTNKTYLNFVKCDSDEEDGVLHKVEEIIKELPTTENILLLGRYNYDAISVGFKGKIDMKENRIMVKIAGRELPFLSVHSAKGLEADHVILVNCNQGAYGFPSLIEDDPILDFVLSKSEAYPFAEERRLFYVAMTRARKRMYILYDQKRPSPFIGEFLLRIERGSYLCPRCLEGKIEAIKDGIAANGDKYRSFVCSNREGCCDFFETRYRNLTPPPGILISDDMTAQDIERLREERRNLGRMRSYPNPPYPPISDDPQTPLEGTEEGSPDDLPF